jgi:uncharacterized protein (UPF0335 family)
MATSEAVKKEPATTFAKHQLTSIIDRLDERTNVISDDIDRADADSKGNGL